MLWNESVQCPAVGTLAPKGSLSFRMRPEGTAERPKVLVLSLNTVSAVTSYNEVPKAYGVRGEVTSVPWWAMHTDPHSKCTC